MNIGKNKAISEASKRRKEIRSGQLEMSIEGNRIYLRALGNNAISVKIDVTPLWHFFKETIEYQKSKKSTPLTDDK